MELVVGNMSFMGCFCNCPDMYDSVTRYCETINHSQYENQA